MYFLIHRQICRSGFLISSLWGGQEGTFLLWIFFVVLMALVMIRTAGSFEKGNMVFVNLFLISILIILLKKSPFELMPVFRSEGAGLNPLLQNFWMQIHPPIMFVGFAGVVFPFAFAMTGLIERKYTQWAESARTLDDVYLGCSRYSACYGWVLGIRNTRLGWFLGMGSG